MFHPHNTGVGSMGCPKGIIDKHGSKLGKLISEGLNFLLWNFDFMALAVFIWSFFLTMKSHIFAEKNFILWRVNPADYIFSNTVF